MRKLGPVLFLLLEVGVLAFTALNNVHLFWEVFGHRDTWYLAVLALVVTEGALLAWREYYRAGADGAFTRAVALVMTGVTALFVVCGAGADLWLLASDAGLVAASDMLYWGVLVAVFVLMAAHVTGVMVCRIMADSQREFDDNLEAADAEREANQFVNIAGLAAARSEARHVARLAAPAIAAQFGNKLRQRYGLPLRALDVSPASGWEVSVPTSRAVVPAAGDARGPAVGDAHPRARRVRRVGGGTSANPKA